MIGAERDKGGIESENVVSGEDALVFGKLVFREKL